MRVTGVQNGEKWKAGKAVCRGAVHVVHVVHKIHSPATGKPECGQCMGSMGIMGSMENERQCTRRVSPANAGRVRGVQNSLDERKMKTGYAQRLSNSSEWVSKM